MLLTSAYAVAEARRNLELAVASFALVRLSLIERRHARQRVLGLEP